MNVCYLCKGARSVVNLKDVQDTIGSLQTTRQYSWRKSRITVIEQTHVSLSHTHTHTHTHTHKQLTLCDRCRGRAGVRWCLPAPAPPDILHILLCPSTRRPLRKHNEEQPKSATVWVWTKSGEVVGNSWIRICKELTLSVICDYWKRKLFVFF